MRSKNCGSNFVKKCGFTKAKNQRFECKDCLKKFTFKRKNKAGKLFASYITEKKTLNALAKENNICEKRLRNRVFTIEIAKPQKVENLKEIILLIDTTYWGKDFGVVVFKDAISGKFIWWHFINAKEKLEHYELGFEWCRKQGYIIKGVVSDGFKGLAKIIIPTPFGICQVHIQRAVMKKLTRKPPSVPSSKKAPLELSF